MSHTAHDVLSEVEEVEEAAGLEQVSHFPRYSLPFFLLILAHVKF